MIRRMSPAPHPAHNKNRISPVLIDSFGLILLIKR